MATRAPRLRSNCETVRKTSTARGYNARWQRTSKRRLAEYPLCATCETEGRTTAATITDHIVPHRGDERLFWDPDNWQSLCKPCHDAKTRAGL